MTHNIPYLVSNYTPPSACASTKQYFELITLSLSIDLIPEAYFIAAATAEPGVGGVGYTSGHPNQ